MKDRLFDSMIRCAHRKNSASRTLAWAAYCSVDFRFSWRPDSRREPAGSGRGHHYGRDSAVLQVSRSAFSPCAGFIEVFGRVFPDNRRIRSPGMAGIQHDGALTLRLLLFSIGFCFRLLLIARWSAWRRLPWGTAAQSGVCSLRAADFHANRLAPAGPHLIPISFL